ncbi:MAG: hypothetical protein GY701_20365 [Sulfitobacter sp.]|nr:hypothetical protein [Sulfitobacter sp.]
MSYPCLCCGYLTLLEEPPGTFDICPVCRWEDDFAETPESGSALGANGVSLAQAQRNFVEFGASDERFVDSVRPPKAEELPSDTPSNPVGPGGCCSESADE